MASKKMDQTVDALGELLKDLGVAALKGAVKEGAKEASRRVGHVRRALENFAQKIGAEDEEPEELEAEVVEHRAAPKKKGSR